MEPIPKDIDFYLSAEQIAKLNDIKRYGLELAFIRRNNLLKPQAFVKLRNKAVYAILCEKGSLKFNHEVSIRNYIDEELVMRELKKLSRLPR